MTEDQKVHAERIAAALSGPSPTDRRLDRLIALIEQGNALLARIAAALEPRPAAQASVPPRRDRR